MPSINPFVSVKSAGAPASPTVLKSPKGERLGENTLEEPSAMPDSGPHAFRPPDGATRSPCPALNTLSNHSYLPHDGRNITFFDIVSALQAGFGLSPGFALFMAIGTFTLLRRPSLAPFDLHGTARHNFIEHNASMVHDDAPAGAEYAPIDVDLKLLHEFLAKSHRSETGSHSVITTDNIVAGRIEREAVSGPVDALHAELGRAEFAMVVEIFGKGTGRELRRDDLEVFLRENRLPEGWAPSHTLHLWEAVVKSKEMRVAMKSVKAAGEQETSGKGEGVFARLQTTVQQLLK